MTDKKTLRLRTSLGIAFPAIFYLLFGIYLIVFPILFDTQLFAIILLSSFCIIAGFGLFLLKRWSLWLALVLSPCIIVSAGFAFSCSRNYVGFIPNIQTGVFHVTLILWMILTPISILFLIDKRKTFK